MRNAKYKFYVVKLLNLPFRKCPEYVCAPKGWIAKSIKKGIFVRYPSKKNHLMRKLVRKRRKYEKHWKFYRAELIFGADTYDEVKKCIKERKFNECQDFWVPEKKIKFRLSTWRSSSFRHVSPTGVNTVPLSKVDKPQMKVAPTRNHQNAAIKMQITRVSSPNMATHKIEVGKELTTSAVKSVDQATYSSESINMSENRLLPLHQNQTNNQPNRTIVRMSTMISDVIDKACPQNKIINDNNSQNRALHSGPILEAPSNQLNTLDHGSCLEQKSHTQNLTSDKDTEMRAYYEKVNSNNNMHTNLLPSNVSNSPISSKLSYQSFEYFNANQPLPHTGYLHPHPYTPPYPGTLAGKSAVMHNIDQRRSPQRHITNPTSYPHRESRHASSFWDNERMRHELRTHSLTRRHMEVNGYQKINSQNATTNTSSFSGAIQSFHKPVQDRLSQPVEDRSSFGLKDYLLLDQTSLKQVNKRTTGKNPIPYSSKNTNPSAPHNPSNLVNRNIRPSFQEHFSAIHQNFIFEDLSTQTQDVRNTGTIDSNQRAYLQSKQQDYTPLTDQNYSRPYMPQPRAPVEGYSNRDLHVQDMLIRNPVNLNSPGISHHQHSQGMPIPLYKPQPSTSLISERRPMHTFPNFQDNSRAGIHHRHLNERTNIKQIPSTVHINRQQDLRRVTYFENSTDTINVNGSTQGNKNIKEIQSSRNDSCSSCQCSLHCKNRVEPNKEDNYLKQSAKNNTENMSSHTIRQTSKSPNEERFSAVRVGSSFAKKTNIEKLQAVDFGAQSNNPESYRESRLTVIRKSNSKNVTHDIKQNADYKIITRYLGSFVKNMHLFSSRMLEMYNEDQRTLREQKEILEDLMKLITSKNTIIDDAEYSSDDD